MTIGTIENKDLTDNEFDTIGFNILNEISDNPYVLTIDSRRTLAGVNPKLNRVTDQFSQSLVYVAGKVLSITDKGAEFDIELKVEDFITGDIKKLSDTIHTTYQKGGIDLIGKPMLEVNNSYYFMLQVYDPTSFGINNYYDTTDSQEFYVGAYSTAGHLLASNLIFTQAVDSIQAFHQGALVIKQGRDFNERDYKEGKVCLVSEEYAKENNLSIGDKVNYHMLHCGINLSGEAINSNISSIAIEQQTVNPDVTGSPQADFEVVGTYKSFMEDGRVASDKFYLSRNTVFIPMAGYPQELWNNLDEYFKNETYASLISIEIQTGKEKQFIDALTKSGFPLSEYKLTIDDGGYKKLASALNSMKENALQFILLFLIAMLAVFILFIYLYLDKSKKSYIIMRLLGVKRSSVTRSVLSGLLLIGFTGIILGTLTGGLLSSKVVEQAYEQAKESVLGTDFSVSGQEGIFQFSSRVPLSLILIIAGTITVLLILFTIAGLKGLEGKKDVKVFLS